MTRRLSSLSRQGSHCTGAGFLPQYSQYEQKRGTCMRCPVCAEPELVMSERQGIEIDYCPQCRGVWLDRGQLDKLIERSATMTEPRRHTSDRPHYDDHDRDYDPRRKKKREG